MPSILEQFSVRTIKVRWGYYGLTYTRIAPLYTMMSYTD